MRLTVISQFDDAKLICPIRTHSHRCYRAGLTWVPLMLLSFGPISGMARMKADENFAEAEYSALQHQAQFGLNTALGRCHSQMPIERDKFGRVIYHTTTALQGYIKMQ